MGWITDLLSVVLILWGFPGSSDDKKPACSAGNLALIPGSGRSLGEGNGYPLQYSCWRIPGTGSLVGYSPRGQKESEMTERTHTPKHSDRCVAMPHCSFHLSFPHDSCGWTVSWMHIDQWDCLFSEVPVGIAVHLFWFICRLIGS